MPRTNRFLDIRRDPHSDEVRARGSDAQTHSVLQRSGFVSVVRRHDLFHRVPAGLAGDDEYRLATDAVAHLRAAGYHVDRDADFDTASRAASYLPRATSVAHVAEHLRGATTTGEATEALTELTADHDGVLAEVEEALIAAADFHAALGQMSDPSTARRLRQLADEHLRVIRTALAETRNQLADRHAAHPGRSPCTGEVPADKHEQAACACPPPPRTPPALQPPTAAGPRR
ncbi:hypothetical protein [Streptomyces sp. GF20]|uniref:hypothetical protein n=1 Tax=Streptomyces sp. GF20 TaxID=2692235 RepID=UPI001915A353|nr:hypothetical protein [Streptomyces sp. GF20]